MEKVSVVINDTVSNSNEIILSKKVKCETKFCSPEYQSIPGELVSKMIILNKQSLKRKKVNVSYLSCNDYEFNKRILILLNIYGVVEGQVLIKNESLEYCLSYIETKIMSDRILDDFSHKLEEEGLCLIELIFIQIKNVYRWRLSKADNKLYTDIKNEFKKYKSLTSKERNVLTKIGRGGVLESITDMKMKTGKQTRIIEHPRLEVITRFLGKKMKNYYPSMTNTEIKSSIVKIILMFDLSETSCQLLVNEKVVAHHDGNEKKIVKLKEFDTYQNHKQRNKSKKKDISDKCCSELESSDGVFSCNCDSRHICTKLLRKINIK